MTQLPSWPRPHLQPGGAPAQLFYKVHGTFEGLQISRSRHRSNGIPAGLSLQSYRADAAPEVMAFGTDVLFRDALYAMGEQTVAAALNAPGCMVLRGEVEPSDSLDYFRDAVGVIQALLDAGGVAVFDPYQLTWWSAQEWRARAFEPAGPVPLRHVVTLVSDEGDGTRWVHTRGLLKFGRPDISVRSVDADRFEAVLDLCSRLIDMQASGAVVPDGQVIRMEGLPDWTCRTLGSLDDPDFNNRHIEIGP